MHTPVARRSMRDPTAETSSARRARRAPHATLKGRTIGLFCIGKARSDEFLDQVQLRLAERGFAVKRFGKPTNAKTATMENIEQVVAGCDAVIVGLSD